MTTKKTTSNAKCCTHKKKASFLILLLIILALLVIFLPSSHEKAIVTDMPVVEMITDSVEVIAPDTVEVFYDDNRVITPVAEQNEDEVEDLTPLLTLDSQPPVFARNQVDAIEFVGDFFENYNKGNFQAACDAIVDTKCDATSQGSVARFGEEVQKTENGYENLSLRQMDVPDFHSEVICVEYDYRYADSSNPEPVHEVMSFYVLGDKITYRICEEKSRGNENLECPIPANRTFCL